MHFRSNPLSKLFHITADLLTAPALGAVFGSVSSIITSFIHDAPLLAGVPEGAATAAVCALATYGLQRMLLARDFRRNRTLTLPHITLNAIIAGIGGLCLSQTVGLAFLNTGPLSSAIITSASSPPIVPSAAIAYWHAFRPYIKSNKL